MSYNRTIQPSTFRRSIDVLKVIPLQDSAGGTSSTLEVDYSAKAYVSDLSTDRRAYYGMDLFTAAWEVIMYALDRTFTTASMVQYEGKILQVKSWEYDNQSYKRFIILLCVESSIT